MNKNFYPHFDFGIRNLWYNDFTSLNLTSEIGIRYLFSNYFALNLDIAFNFVTDDKIDGLDILKSSNDFYTTFTIGFSYAVDLTVADDIDSDGVKNLEDNCPEQAEDFDGFQDDDGCPEFDNDNDGIVDSKDECVNEAEDFDGFNDQDGCPDSDNDGDGILDYEDNCADTKEDFDGFNDLDGCPELDNDNDGIVDNNDQCPDEPENFNSFEDSDGCPDQIPEPEIIEETNEILDLPEKKIIPEKKIRIVIPNEFLLEGDKLFTNSSSNIKSSSHKKLNQIADQMKNNSDFKWRIEGHLDNAGSSRELKSLSTARAKSVMNYFISKGLSPKLFQAIGLADQVPVAPNSTIQGKLKNRRILIKRIR